MTAPWDPPQILEAARAFQVSRLLLTAAELDLFSLLEEQARSSEEIATRLGLDLRALETYLHALVALGLLEHLPTGFRTPERLISALSSPSRDAVLPMVRHMAALWSRWGDLTEVLRRGHPEPDLPRSERDAEEQRAFIQAMHVIGRDLAPDIVNSIPLAGVTRLLDVGGASGTYTEAFLRAKGDLRVTLLDLPEVIPMARDRLERDGLLSRVDLVAADFEREPLPGGHDLAFLGAIVHQNDRSQNRALFQKVREALRPGGKIVIRDHVMEPSRDAPMAGALFAINMLVATRGGSTYTFEELREDLEASGFVEVSWNRKGERMDCLVTAVGS